LIAETTEEFIEIESKEIVKSSIESASKYNYGYQIDTSTNSFYGIISKEGLDDIHIYGSLEPNGTHLNVKVDLIPNEVMNGVKTLDDAHELLKGKYNDAIRDFKRAFEGDANNLGYESVNFYNKRETGVRKGQIQNSNKID
jgi:hypothetical protein